jgi:hypothetical protein
MMALNEPAAYNSRLASRKPCWLAEKEWTATKKGERRDNKGERKERLNLASFKLKVLGKLCYMITLIAQQYATIYHAMP